MRGAAILSMMAAPASEALPVAPGAVLVKVCGVVRQEDASCAIGAGANLVGVIFAKSKRQARVFFCARSAPCFAFGDLGVYQKVR